MISEIKLRKLKMYAMVMRLQEIEYERSQIELRKKIEAMNNKMKPIELPMS